MNREDWLQKAIEKLRPVFKQKNLTLPERIRISCGWPSRGGTSKNRRVLGQCWASDAAMDGITQIFMSPYLADPVRVLEGVVHEMIHAVDSTWKHGANFRAAAKDIGLVGNPTATTAGDELRVRLNALAEELGDYDNSHLDTAQRPAGTPKPSTNRMLKISCPQAQTHENREEYILRGSKKVLALGIPRCPICGEELKPEEKEEEE